MKKNKYDIKNIESQYYLEIDEKSNGLIRYIVRKSDQQIIAVLDIFSAEIMEYWEYKDIMTTRTACFKKEETPILRYFFGEYFEKKKEGWQREDLINLFLE